MKKAWIWIVLIVLLAGAAVGLLLNQKSKLQKEYDSFRSDTESALKEADSANSELSERVNLLETEKTELLASIDVLSADNSSLQERIEGNRNNDRST